MRRRGSERPAVPQDVANPCQLCLVPARHEEEVRKPVQVRDHLRANLLLPRKRDHEPLGPSAHGSRHVELRRRHVTAWQNEARQRLQLLVPLVHPRFQVGNVPGLNSGDREPLLVLFQDAEVRTEVEQHLLDRVEPLPHRPIQPRGNRHADDAVQFVDRAVCLDSQAVLRDALATPERGGAGVAGAGVHTIDSDHVTSMPERGAWRDTVRRVTMSPEAQRIRRGVPMTAPTPQRCIRCHSLYETPPHIMAGRKFCCASCSVGSACEHQGVHRAANVRRYDTMFDRFRQVAHTATPYETDVEPERA